MINLCIVIFQAALTKDVFLPARDKLFAIFTKILKINKSG